MNPAADVWSKVITLMQPDMTATTINTWFDDASAVALEDDRFVLYSPTRFKRDIIATHMWPLPLNRFYRCWESLVVSCMDKLCARAELMGLVPLPPRGGRLPAPRLAYIQDKPASAPAKTG